MDKVCITLRSGQQILVDADLNLLQGHAYGLIGRNGVGKSILLKYMACGAIQQFPENINVGYVGQELKVYSAEDRKPLQLLIDKERSKETRLKTREEALLAELEQLGDSPDEHTLSRINTDLDLIYADPNYTFSTKIEDKKREALNILAQLGFRGAFRKYLTVPIKTLSGGWKSKVAIAYVLFSKPDLILLDEPTNHLDLRSILFLYQSVTDLIQSGNKCAVIVSHNVNFLNNITTDIIQWNEKTKQLAYYTGNYFQFLKTVRERMERQAHMYDRQEKKRARYENAIKKEKQRAKKMGKKSQDNKSSGVISSRQHKLYHLGQEKTETGRRWQISYMGQRPVVKAPKKSEANLKFKFECAEILKRGPVIQLNKVWFGYFDKARAADVCQHNWMRFDAPHECRDCQERNVYVWCSLCEACGECEEADAGAVQLEGSLDSAAREEEGMRRWILRDVTVEVTTESRIAVIGENGSGKSTLVQLMTQQVEPLRGGVWRDKHLSIAYFKQHHIRELDLGKTPLQYFAAKFEGSKEADARQHLGKYGINNALPTIAMRELSGGQRVRVIFAAIMWERPAFLVMDEPTNHLDLESIEALIDGLTKFDGGILLVSHDERLLSTLVKEVWIVSHARVEKMEGTFADYMQMMYK
eukprot:TRINITY_DN10602_c0_g1_i1.p1 TRINITY_DN10602_c0_g1~~TRINITY_DN10602_c0_g1_i1.p1  ORF type:complete len:680 (+),score=147.61 TRINITY_DN10602_c0_g1_i1:113-2041(+)